MRHLSVQGAHHCPCRGRSCRPLDMQRLEFPGELWFVLVNPCFQAPTAKMRAVLPAEVPMASAVHNCAMSGTLVRPPEPPDLGPQPRAGHGPWSRTKA